MNEAYVFRKYHVSSERLQEIRNNLVDMPDFEFVSISHLHGKICEYLGLTKQNEIDLILEIIKQMITIN